MVTLIELLDAAYNVVRPNYSQSMYPVLEDKSIVALDPLSSFVAANTEERPRAYVLKFIAAMSVIGSSIDSTKRVEFSGTAWNANPQVAALNAAVTQIIPFDSTIAKSYAFDARNPKLHALAFVREVLMEIPATSWLHIDPDTLRFARALVEFAQLAHNTEPATENVLD